MYCIYFIDKNVMFILQTIKNNYILKFLSYDYITVIACQVKKKPNIINYKQDSLFSLCPFNKIKCLPVPAITQGPFLSARTARKIKTNNFLVPHFV